MGKCSNKSKKKYKKETIPKAIREQCWIQTFGKSFEQLTRETVKAFLIDSKKSKFKI